MKQFYINYNKTTKLYKKTYNFAFNLNMRTTVSQNAFCNISKCIHI